MPAVFCIRHQDFLEQHTSLGIKETSTFGKRKSQYTKYSEESSSLCTEVTRRH